MLKRDMVIDIFAALYDVPIGKAVDAFDRNHGECVRLMKMTKGDLEIHHSLAVDVLDLRNETVKVKFINPSDYDFVVNRLIVGLIVGLDAKERIVTISTKVVKKPQILDYMKRHDYAFEEVS